MDRKYIEKNSGKYKKTTVRRKINTTNPKRICK